MLIAALATVLFLSHPDVVPASDPRDTIFLAIHSAAFVPLAPVVDTPLSDTVVYNDTLSFDLNGGFVRKHHPTHAYSVSEIENGRQVPYLENFSIIDFNRATGYFLGLGTPGQVDLGKHEELGADGSFGYGFASKRWEYRLGGEFRLPLANAEHIEQDTSFKRHIYSIPTIAAGAAFHNITSTDDSWRESRLENALDAFFAREDFRNYYKLAGWNAYLAFRPRQNTELRLDWRSDDYQSLAQEVFYGRFGGNKVLPPNPSVAEGEMHSLVITAQDEHVHTRYKTTTNFFGDSVEIEQLKGVSSELQTELGHMPGSDFGFNRYLLDARSFNPVLRGINIDARLRFEATTGDNLPQKLEYLGGPGSLPALYQFVISGNRMLLLNTEVRLNLNMLSSFFHSPDFNLVIYNDFAKMGTAGGGESIVQGFQFTGASSLLYNIGIGLGWTSGVQIGTSWRTDIKANPRVMFRLERPF